MKKAFRLLIWFFYNLRFAIKIYNEQRIDDTIGQLNTWEYRRNRSEMQKARDILFHNYADASSSAKKFFWKYYLYRVVKRTVRTICILMFFVILLTIGISQLDWHYGEEFALGMVCSSIEIVLLIFIVKEIKNMQNMINESKSYKI